MDEKKLLKEAQDTIENIKRAQNTLEKYEIRLEKIISKLEYEIYSEEHLTLSDIQVINNKLDKEVERQVLRVSDVEEQLTAKLQQVPEELILIEDEDEDYEIVEEIQDGRKRKVRKRKKRKRFNFVILLSILSLLLTLSIHYVKNTKVINLLDKTYFIYEPVDMEPSIVLMST